MATRLTTQPTCKELRLKIISEARSARTDQLLALIRELTKGKDYDQLRRAEELLSSVSDPKEVVGSE